MIQIQFTPFLCICTPKKYSYCVLMLIVSLVCNNTHVNCIIYVYWYTCKLYHCCVLIRLFGNKTKAEGPVSISREVTYFRSEILTIGKPRWLRKAISRLLWQMCHWWTEFSTKTSFDSLTSRTGGEISLGDYTFK